MNANCATDIARMISKHLSAFTYQWNTEADLQAAIRHVLLARFDHVQWEVILSARDRPDFIVGVSDIVVAIEVKVAGARNAILRQLGRYAAHDIVDAVVLASGRRALLWQLPTAIHGKPVVGALVSGRL